ncbi:hypothetical protein KP509_14G021200 [Ceratopteris richardii]|uniref:Uncharacterized protein n=1 Tax=Ceratopteris richardii TaxID=49495 RepID=A0A8T2T7M6_CERRI|nr:hypothetical protein KP509_14G021200 [Ceratopteris richardii]
MYIFVRLAYLLPSRREKGGPLRQDGSICFSVNQTKETEDRLHELEVLNKVLEEGIEAYDKLTKDVLGDKRGEAGDHMCSWRMKNQCQRAVERRKTV